MVWNPFLWRYSPPGYGTQMAVKSWWPLPTTWREGDCGVNLGYWTELNEEWYQRRLKDIQDGKAEPLPANKWRDRLRGLKESRTLKASIEKFSLEYLHNHRYFA